MSPVPQNISCISLGRNGLQSWQTCKRAFSGLPFAFIFSIYFHFSFRLLGNFQWLFFSHTISFCFTNPFVFSISSNYNPQLHIVTIESCRGTILYYKYFSSDDAGNVRPSTDQENKYNIISTDIVAIPYRFLQFVFPFAHYSSQCMFMFPRILT